MVDTVRLVALSGVLLFASGWLVERASILKLVALCGGVILTGAAGLSLLAR